MIDLRAERLNRGMSQREFAKAAGVTQRVLQRAESRASKPHPASALKIADYLGVNVTDIWPAAAPSETEAAA